MHRASTPTSFTIGVITAVALVVGGVTASVVAVASSSSVSAEGATAEPTPSEAPRLGSAGGFQDPVVAAAPASVAGVTASRIEIPSIEVDAPLEQLAIDTATGQLGAPVEWQSAGWYSDGTLPGQVGPALIAGHIDSYIGPAVFARLDELAAGAEIRVTLSDGSVETFIVDSAVQASKADFPTEAVYGPTPQPQLRLVTCDGQFNRATGDYPDNLVVFATLA